MAAASTKPWGEAIRTALAAEPDRWFPAVELVDRYAPLIPPDRLRSRSEQRKGRRTSSADRSAASTLIGGVIYTAIRNGSFERRLTPDGRLEVRLSRVALEEREAREARKARIAKEAQEAREAREARKAQEAREMADAGLITVADAAAALGVTQNRVYYYVKRGLLPATQAASGLAVVPARYVSGFVRPRRGPPLRQQRAWDCILEGRPDPDNPHLYAYRGTASRWSGEADAVAALLERHDVVVGGVYAAVVDGAQLDPPPDAAHVYVAEASMNGGPSGAGPTRGLVADPLGEVVIRSVASDSWRRLRRCARTEEGVLYAPPAAAALDLLLSPHPHERQAAQEFLKV